MTARLDDHILYITCLECNTTFLAGQLPPRGYADRTERGILEAVDKRVRSQIDSITYSVCPWCSGTTNTELVPASDTPLGDRPIETAVRHVCQHCEANGWTTVGQRLLAHPAVVSFHYLNDVAIADRPLRELAFAVTDRYTTVRDRDPLRIELSLELERDRLRATLDERADVIDLSRTFRIGPPSEQ